jgi:hemerythrin-like domain-containing protein
MGKLWQIDSAPGVGFEQPLAMLQACHERVHRMLDLLNRLRAHLNCHGADDQARTAAHDVIRYFDLAAPHHHEDEERHVFPRMLTSGVAQLIVLAHQLQADHRVMVSDWAAVRPVLQQVAGGTLHHLAPEHHAAIDRFSERYATHIRREEDLAYPATVVSLSVPELQAMGAEMAARRIRR